MEIWDRYGQWDEISHLTELNAVKAKITGDKRAWRPNFVPPTLEYAFDYAAQEHVSANPHMPPTVLDFGCGLGRNAPMLRKFFPRVVGFDLPEMLERFRTETPNLYWRLYDQAYDSLATAIKSDKYCLLYDSVVFQHIIDVDYLSTMFDTISENNSLRTIVSIYNNAGVNYRHLDILRSRKWRIWHTENEAMSFEGSSHCVTIFRR
jgi:SAM-dependent methyltransferase